jgi:formimidoylglutamate deiminase
MTLLHARHALTADGWQSDVTVAVEGGRIASITAGIHGAGQAVGVLLPAPVNLHSHTFQRAMAGMTEKRGAGRDSFWTWRDLMYRFLDHLTPEQVQAIAALAMVEMAEAGYAAVAEFHYLHHQSGGAPHADLAEMSGRITAAAAETGLGLTLLPVLYQRGGCDGRALGPGQVRFGNDPDRFARLVEGAAAHLAQLPGDAVLGVAPHSLRAVTVEGLALATTLRPEAPVHIHLAEQVAEVEELLAHTGARPVEWLLAHAPVDGRWCPIHCTQMTPAETEGLARSGAVAGLCPVTEANLGDGIFDGVNWASAGGAFGVGTDSNLQITLTGELRLYEYSQRLRDRGRAMLATDACSTGRALWEGAAKGGAQAAGRASGAIAPGMWADLMALDAEALTLEGRVGDELLDAAIFAGGDGLVTDLWSAGRHIVTGGRHIARDAVERRYRATMAALRAQL